jgi:hypothetical protein
MFGATHGEIGACLVGMWNLPSAIVDAAAFHHEPPLGEPQQLTALAAVHIANVLERELESGHDEMMVPPIISTPFLNQLGLLQRLPIWRARFANGRAPKVETDQSGPSGSRTASHLPASATTRTGTSGQPQIDEEQQSDHATRPRRSWVHVGIVAALVLLAVWFKTQPEVDQTKQVYARRPAQTDEVPQASEQTRKNGSAPEPTPARQAAPAVAVSEKPAVSEEPTEPPAPSTTPSETETVSKPVSKPAAEPAVTTPPVATITNVPTATITPEPKPRPDFRLNGIIYTAVKPSAIVNGQIVHLGDQVDGATVVWIGRTNVTLQIKGQRKSYALP